MINVIVARNSEKHITGFTMDGHADFDVHGKDLVCAGASAVVFGSVNAVFALTDYEPAIDMADEGGYLSVKLEDTSDDRVQLILETMIVSLKTIESEYSEFIKIEHE
ncbi:MULTISPECIES: ribosomal-processing cysteine protease Prp [Jeotgalicoccus]|jgi:Predicted ribosomal protein|uniref:Ribosomal processing cysteine protease Prp n=1 Tax=Jeotgalicoccus nanhaiensis TaxID=568603 RepID=A0ABR9XWI8_9STAP|nr:ribosomal-processing cysteine protease Prp [Jeotgalicoccus nanhaiensis]MBF0753198.1 ribosomal-processing cysteine protease Prp [Jeotgalicoccus nanhaiensis]TFU62368.1 ribosomal-processing cysteine protease Prp [Jeotgalicoccus nanhaiensis]